MDIRPRLNPFPGLRPFMLEEADLFFGRDRQSDELVRRLASRRFLAVVGTSGGGKSSLVRAGLLPSLEGGFMAEAGTHWRIAVLRPQDDPIGSLAKGIVETGALSHLELTRPAVEDVVETRLRRSSLGLVEVARLARLESRENLLIVVDQFEELFRFADLAKQREAGDEAPAFVKLLLEAARHTDVPVYVVITMRSDFLGDCARFRDLPEAISDSQYLIPRLTRDQLQAAITGPICVCGGRIAPSLVQRLLNDVGDDMDQLPVLQHALMRAWNHWERSDPHDRPIDLSDLEAIGGMAEALSRHADEAFESLATDRHRAIAERLFKCLTEKGTDNREIRRPTALSRIGAIAGAAPAHIIEVIDVFRAPERSFLMPPHDVKLQSESIIDIAHESLIRQWTRLRAWVDEESESRSTYLRLVEAVRLREAGKAGLWGEPDLTYARQWQQREGPNAAWAEQYGPRFPEVMTFLAQSQVAHKRARWSRIGLWVALPVAIVLAGLSAFSLWAAAQAERFGRLARARELAAQAEVIRLDSPEQLDNGVVLAVESLRFGDLIEGDRVLRELLRLLRPKVATVSATGPRGLLAVSPNGQHIIARRRNDALAVIDGETGGELGELSLGPFKIWAFSPDSRRLAALLPDGRIEVWDLATRTMVGSLQAGADISALEFSGNGEVLLLASRQGVSVWRVGEATPGRIGMMREVVVTRDGALLASRGSDAVLRFLDTRTARNVSSAVVPDNGGRVRDRFSPDGRLLAVTEGASVTVVSPERSVPVALQQHAEMIKEVVWSPTGRLLVSVGRSSVWMWEPRQGGNATRVSVDADIESVAWSPDGERLVIAAVDRQREDGTLRLWDARTREVKWIVHQEPFFALAFSGDGQQIATAQYPRTVRLWDVKTGSELARLSSQSSLNGVCFVASGRRLLTRADQEVIVWDLSDQPGTVLLSSSEPHLGPGDIASRIFEQRFDALSHDGRFFLASNTEEIAVWETADGRRVASVPKRGGELAAALSSDGKVLAVADQKDGVTLWDLSAAPELRKGKVITASAGGASLVAVSADGRRVIWKPMGPVRIGADDDGAPLRVADDDGAPSNLPVTAASDIQLGPDGRYVIVHDRGGIVRNVRAGSDEVRPRQDKLEMVEIGTSRVTSANGGDRESTTAFAISPDSLRVAWVDARGRVSIRDVSGGPPVRMEGLGDAGRLAFSPDGRYLVAVSPGTLDDADTVVRVWATETSRLIARLPPLPVRAATLDADGKNVIVVLDMTSGLAAVRYPLRAEDLIVQACALLPRNMSREDWEQYFADEAYRKTCPAVP